MRASVAKNCYFLPDEVAQQREELLPSLHSLPALQASLRTTYLFPENLFTLLRHWEQQHYREGVEFLTDFLARSAGHFFLLAVQKFPSLSPQDREDLLMECLVRFITKLRTRGANHPCWDFWCANFTTACARWLYKTWTRFPKPCPQVELAPFRELANPSDKSPLNPQEEAIANVMCEDFLASLHPKFAHVLQRLLQGFSPNEIAEELQISDRLVRYYRKQLQSEWIQWSEENVHERP